MVLRSILAGMAVAVIATGSALAADCALSADAVAGKALASQCTTCHSFDADKPSRPTGPNLHDIYGEKAGSRSDFPKYSEAMLAANAKGMRWTDEPLYAYLADPKAFLTSVNGQEIKHAMFFFLKDEGKRKQVISYLKEIKGKRECN